MKPVLTPFLSRKSGASELYLIRHADALPGEETVIPGGGYDSQPLSRLGQAQSEALAKWLTTINFDAVYASPLRRTQETAAPLAQVQQLEVAIEPDLREVRLSVDLGGPTTSDDSGATAASLRERLQEIIRLIGTKGKWSAIPGSEDSEAFRARVTAVIGQIIERHPGQRVAVFSHGGFINAYMAELLGLELDFFFPIYNTSVSVLRCLGQQVSLVTLNDVSHLRVAEIEVEP